MKKKRYPKSTPFWRFLFVVYILVMLWLLFDRPSAQGAGLSYADLIRSNMNLTPLRTIGPYWERVKQMDFSPNFYHSFINLGGNIFLFSPVGYFMPRLRPFLRNFFSFLLACTLAITLVELLQLVTLLGSLDIDDLILNLFGMLTGYLLFMIFHKRGKK